MGLDAELSYLRNDRISHYTLSFNLLVHSQTSVLHVTWHAKSKVEYKVGFRVDNIGNGHAPDQHFCSGGRVWVELSWTS